MELFILANQVLAEGATLRLLKPSDEQIKAIKDAKQQARNRKVHLVQPLDEILEYFLYEAEAIANFAS